MWINLNIIGRLGSYINVLFNLYITVFTALEAKKFQEITIFILLNNSETIVNRLNEN